MNDEKKVTVSFWEQNAHEWSDIIDRNAILSRPITNAAIQDRLRQLNAKSILDFGCGEGWLGRMLPTDTDYLGIDGSQKLIDLAKMKNPNREYLCINYDQILSGVLHSNNSFDVVLFNFSIFHENIGVLFARTQKYLNNDGRLLIQTIHPCFLSNKYCNEWLEDDFSSVSQSIKGKMQWFKRTLSDWSNLFFQSDLLIEKIDEPSSESSPVSIIFTLKKASQN